MAVRSWERCDEEVSGVGVVDSTRLDWVGRRFGACQVMALILTAFGSLSHLMAALVSDERWFEEDDWAELVELAARLIDP